MEIFSVWQVRFVYVVVTRHGHLAFVYGWSPSGLCRIERVDYARTRPRQLP